MSQPDSTQPPDGLETRERPKPLPMDQDRPDWLVGAADVLEGQDEAPLRPLAPVPPPKSPQPSKSPPPASSLSVVPGGQPNRPRSWSGAASSIPKLSVISTRGLSPPSDETDADQEGHGPHGDLAAPLPGLEGEAEKSPTPPAPAFRPLHEPWYLVWGEALLTSRKVQVGALLGLALLVALAFFPRHREPGASLHGILREPARFEGRSVVVRGEVLESFDVGQGYAFNLRQGRDTVVVFSPSRRPEMHQRVEVIGTVSTGYLDGEPRVAIFEAPSSK